MTSYAIQNVRKFSWKYVGHLAYWVQRATGLALLFYLFLHVHTIHMLRDPKSPYIPVAILDDDYERRNLSIQGVRVPVERSLSVTVEGRNEGGEEVRLELEGLPARVVQHENDHLDGVLIIDRTDAASRKEALATLRPRPILVGR